MIAKSFFFFFSSRRRHTRWNCDWSSDVCSSDLRDRVSARLVGYALGSALENHDEEGVGSDPRFGENNTFYLHAMAVLPTVQNYVEIENHLLESLRTRALA